MFMVVSKSFGLHHQGQSLNLWVKKFHIGTDAFNPAGRCQGRFRRNPVAMLDDKCFYDFGSLEPVQVALRQLAPKCRHFRCGEFFCCREFMLHKSPPTSRVLCESGLTIWRYSKGSVQIYASALPDLQPCFLKELRWSPCRTAVASSTQKPFRLLQNSATRRQGVDTSSET